MTRLSKIVDNAQNLRLSDHEVNIHRIFMPYLRNNP